MNMRFPIKEVSCPICDTKHLSKKKNALCDECNRNKRKQLYQDTKKGIYYDFCINCYDKKSPNSSSYCNICYNPVSKTLCKFIYFNEYNKNYNQNIIYRYKTEGDNAINRFMLIDAWVMITRYENKWLTKDNDKQVYLMLAELKEYNQNLYTLNWFKEETHRVREYRRMNRSALKTI
jgi:hypothetical protein